MSVKFTKEDFIYESIKVHKDKYDYSLVDYKKSSEKLIIICKEHGPFEQRASNHSSRTIKQELVLKTL